MGLSGIDGLGDTCHGRDSRRRILGCVEGRWVLGGDIWEMFLRKTNIEISTKIFEGYYSGLSGGITCLSGDRLWKTIASYNGGSSGPDKPKAQEYADNICSQFRSGNYQLTN